jgi:hypothetical protein
MKVGFGLWNYPVIALALEIIILFGGIFLYTRSTTTDLSIGKYGMWIFGVLLVLVQLYVFFGEPPSSPSGAAITALVAYLVFAGIAYWLERKRQ